jgi:C4-dicarboxylate transporter
MIHLSLESIDGLSKEDMTLQHVIAFMFIPIQMGSGNPLLAFSVH